MIVRMVVIQDIESLPARTKTVTLSAERCPASGALSMLMVEKLEAAVSEVLGNHTQPRWHQRVPPCALSKTEKAAVATHTLQRAVETLATR